MINYENFLLQVCSTDYTGEFHLKLFNSDIVYFEKMEIIRPKSKVCPTQISSKSKRGGYSHSSIDLLKANKEVVPVGVCMNFVDKIRKDIVFGELKIIIKNGNIYRVEIKQDCKAKELEKYLSESKTG